MWYLNIANEQGIILSQRKLEKRCYKKMDAIAIELFMKRDRFARIKWK